MPIITQSGRIAVAEAVAARPLHLAWGTGDDAWTTPPPESTGSTSLINEVGRRLVTNVGFAVPDVDGGIITTTGVFSVSLVPTKFLYIKTDFDFTDAPSDVIREIGLFTGSTVIAGLPAGQRYFLPAELDSVGRLLHLQHLVPIYRSIAIRENFEVVIGF